MTVLPVLTPRALGWFRITLGVVLVGVIFYIPAPAVPLELQRHYARPDIELIHSIAQNESAIVTVRWITLFAAAMFTAGLFTRSAYAVVVAGFSVLTLIVLESRGAHGLGLPLLTLLGWLAVRWGDGLSVDSQLWRQSVDPKPSVVYGFAIWWPGLTLGLAMLSAAYTKLASTQFEWITTGAVKYHFVTDHLGAKVDWGLLIATSPTLSVIVSAAAVLLEASLILVVLTPKPHLRLVTLGATIMLFGGFYLLQGVLFFPWILLLLALLPWSWLNERRELSRTKMSHIQVAAVASMVTIQLVASLAAIEREPLVSNFPMYSGTFASTDEFDRNMEWRFTTLTEATDENGNSLLPAIRLLRQDDRISLFWLAEDRPVGPDRLSRLCDRYQNINHSVPESISLNMVRGGFDWINGNFREQLPVKTKPIGLSHQCL